MLTADREWRVCASRELAEEACRVIDIEFKGESASAIVLRYRGRAYAYLNRCVHMVRRLDCEHPRLFDPASKLLRCSMHGLVFDPASGDCLSEICAGKRLCALKLVEADGSILFRDKRVSPPGMERPPIE